MLLASSARLWCRYQIFFQRLALNSGTALTKPMPAWWQMASAAQQAQCQLPLARMALVLLALLLPSRRHTGTIPRSWWWHHRQPTRRLVRAVSRKLIRWPCSRRWSVTRKRYVIPRVSLKCWTGWLKRPCGVAPRHRSIFLAITGHR